ncbi:cytochrome C biogenesis protein [Pseudoxanthomonas kalamensis DSM 18571]|uniref:cytochrome c biogenesis protein DipZ n=1 Tax=Pseudoxanthomonas kalamensis TaxID=289483 RepID=UPI001390ED94|nr:cytochrome c biogenesis protein DipZ [Pseudoxanthomonas kalamensis]KAF1709335.1 cytochrome C biogenesis protein [Pseudoxanthomonas kalamensis DSM 18571]
MLLFLLAYLGGVLTILSPCILPVLPFVFSGAGQPFWRSSLPLLAGMVATFALVATLAAVGGGWVVAANQYGRWIALALVAVFGLSLLFPSLATRLSRPLVRVGNRIYGKAQAQGGIGPGASFLLGIATGLLWAPCAGPILGLVLTGAAVKGASADSTLLLLAYGLGAATSLALALLLGGKVFEAMKRSLGVGEWIRRGLGAAMLLGALAIAFGLDTGVLARISTASTGGLEQSLVEKLGGRSDQVAGMARMSDPESLGDEGAMPPLDGVVQWLNSPPLDAAALRGKVVLVDFWTYSCINCLRSLPYVKAWEAKYREQGLVVIGVHTPEFAFERDVDNVHKALRDLGIDYPVAIDNDYAVWKAFDNHYWPAHYFIDAQGRIRYHHFGEGKYDESERVIRQLLREAGASGLDDAPMATVRADGVQQAADFDKVRSSETYLGYRRAQNFASGPVARDTAVDYALPAQLALNDWGLGGRWQVESERAVDAGAGGRIAFRFQARDLHLVLGPGADGTPVRFRVRIDGQAPGAAAGVDVDADGNGTVTEQRLYQLLRQPGEIGERTFEIEFLDPGAAAYAFTFG